MRAVSAALCLSLYATFIYSFAVADEGSVQNEDETEIVSSPTPGSDHLYKGSPYINAVLKFTNPVLDMYDENMEYHLPAGKRSSVVVSMSNIREEIGLPRFSLHSVEGSLHYPGYYEYRIQNMSVFPLQNTIEPGQEASVYYHFRPALELAGRSFDLSIIVHYRDENSMYYMHSVFNHTVSLYEVEEGVDTEMIFLVLLIAALCVFFSIGVWHWCYSKASRRKSSQSHSQDDPFASGSFENEYKFLIENSKSTKTGRSAGTVNRRHGKR